MSFNDELIKSANSIASKESQLDELQQQYIDINEKIIDKARMECATHIYNKIKNNIKYQYRENPNKSKYVGCFSKRLTENSYSYDELEDYELNREDDFIYLGESNSASICFKSSKELKSLIQQKNSMYEKINKVRSNLLLSKYSESKIPFFRVLEHTAFSDFADLEDEESEYGNFSFEENEVGYNYGRKNTKTDKNVLDFRFSSIPDSELSIFKVVLETKKGGLFFGESYRHVLKKTEHWDVIYSYICKLAKADEMDLYIDDMSDTSFQTKWSGGYPTFHFEFVINWVYKRN